MVDPRTLILSKVLDQLGFETVPRSTVLTRLNQIQPDGETALLDSAKAGINVVLKLNEVFNQLGASGAWNFVHIVITDGIDTVSNSSIEELAMLFALVGRGIPKDKCLTVFIGVELSVEAAIQLALLTKLGGDTCQMYNVNSVQLNDIFARISATIGVRRQVNINMINTNGVSAMAFQQTNQPYLNITRKNFAVLLNLDISGSMNGGRFNSLKSSVQSFLRNLDQNDLVSCLVFNERVQLLKNYQPRPQIREIRCATQ